MKSQTQQPIEGIENRGVEWQRRALGLAEDHTPFPWQERLLTQHFAKGTIPHALEIPTGLDVGNRHLDGGARSWGAGAAASRVRRRSARGRRSCDRRGRADQEGGRRHPEFGEALGLTRALAISTLRGQHVQCQAIHNRSGDNQACRITKQSSP